MSTDISFEENRYQVKSRAILGEAKSPAMINFLIKKGFVKTEKTAHVLLIAITILFFLTSILIFAFFVFDINIGKNNTQLTPEQIQQNKERIQEIRKQRELNS